MSSTYLLATNVIYSYTAPAFFVTLGVTGLPVRWSRQIEAEFIASRRRRSPDQATAAQAIIQLMRKAIPDWRATASAELVATLNLPDPNDRHVLAAALQSGADVIVTRNLRDFPPAKLEPLGVRALSPDQALCELYDEDPERIIIAAAGMRAPPLTPEAWLERLRSADLQQCAMRLAPRAGAATRTGVPTPLPNPTEALVTPAFTSTALNGFEGTASVEDGSREVVRAALAGPEDRGGAFTRWEAMPIPW